MPDAKLPLILCSNAPPPRQAGASRDDSPRLDFLELARALDDAPILYPPAASRGLIGAAEKRSASDIRQALLAFTRRRQAGAFVSLSEKVGVPLALLLGRRSRIPHVLVAHHLTSDKKRALQRRSGYLQRFDRVVVQSRVQESYVVGEAGVAPERAHFIYGMVDHMFWRADALTSDERSVLVGSDTGGVGLILSVGRERRDYETLAAAARQHPHRRFVIVASSPWSRQQSDDDPSLIPANIEVRRGLTWVDLRRLYAEASLVVVPLLMGTLYAAGLNGVLEAMAMTKPLIVSETAGIADYIDDTTATRSVTAGDSADLATAIAELAKDPEARGMLGRNARRIVDEGRNLDMYVQNLRQIVRGAVENRG